MIDLTKLPAGRVAAMCKRGARELREMRLARARSNWQGYDPTDEGHGGCAFVACLVLAVIMYAVLLFL